MGESRTLGRGGGNSGGRETSGVDPKNHGVGGEERGREAYGVEETPGGGATEWGRGSNRLWTTRTTTERAGGSNRLRMTRPPTEGAGDSSCGKMNKLKTEREG